jgi:hypothetical protein
MQHPEYLTPQPVQSREDLPDRYLTGAIEGEDGYVKPDIDTMVTELRTDLGGLDVTPEKTLATMYSVAREIGDRALEEADYKRSGGGRAAPMLDGTRLMAQPDSFVVTELDKAGGRSVRGTTSELILGNGWAERGRALTDRMLKKGVRERNAGDMVLLRTMHTVAHESGHALLAGVSEELPSIDGEYKEDLHASHAFVTANPEQAVSGSLKSDVAIQEERFAEGYARLVTKRITKSMGYGWNQRRKILDGLKHNPDMSGKVGSNQIDHLRTQLGAVSLGEAVGEDAATGQQREGKLGYAKPSSTNELVDELRYFGAVTQQDEVGISSAGTADWEATTEHFGQAGPVSRYVGKLVNARESELSPVWSTAKFAGRLVVATAVATTIGLGAMHSTGDHNSPNDHIAPTAGVHQNK